MAGRFITLEGIDGAGKSTHLEALAARLAARGEEVVRTREPGGTELAEEIRRLVLHAPMDPMTEVLLVFAARRDHLCRVVEPALLSGSTVLCDRFTDATFAYQGAGRGFDTNVLAALERWVQVGRQPDLTLWFDLEPEQAIRRLADSRAADRFEAEDAAFFERVRAGYLGRATAEPARFARIDAGADRDGVWRQLLVAIEARGW